MLTFRDASARDVFTALGRFASVNVVFDPTFRDQPVTIDLRNSTLEAALQAVAASTRNFYRVTAQRTITVVPDTPAKRREYEEEVVRTFFLSNADLKETMDLLRIVVDPRRVAPTAATNAITIKDTPERVAAAGTLIAAIDKARPEVVIDVELLEVDRTRLREYGLQIASPGTPPTGIDGQVDDQPRRPDAARPAEPHAVGRLPDQPAGALLPAAQDRQQHAHAGQPAAADLGRHSRAGQVRRARAGAGHDVLADRHRRRRPAADHVVQLREHRREHRHHAAHAPRRPGVAGAQDRHQQHLGDGFGGLPTFGNREINTVIRLQDGETNLLAGLIRDDERRTLEGVAGPERHPACRPAVRAHASARRRRPTSS